MDTTLNIALSMYNMPGVYALLLGSGISASVKIPTGWEITQTILEMYESREQDPPEDQSYDNLLSQIGQTPVERNKYLRQFFEPSEEDRDQGNKLPSLAHKAIAKLVRDGYIKVILTTNFDRLMEKALEDIGIVPDVISSEDMIIGSTPIQHNQITIIKLHGDYRDARTLNTAEELANYSLEKNELLDRIFDEYGLIVCGWSARWDLALRDAIYRIKPRWYSTYWIDKYDLSDKAQELIQHRKATFIQADSDEFFKDVHSTVESLEKINRKSPLTTEIAIEQTKKLLSNPNGQIELEDFVWKESEKAFNACQAPNL